MRATIKTFATLILLTLFGFTATAFAAGPSAPDSESLLDLARPVFDAVMHGNYWAAASLGVVLSLSFARRYMPASWKDGIKGDIIGTAFAFGFAAFGAVANAALAVGFAGMTTALALTALKIGVVAIGGYSVIHKFATWAASTNWFKQHAPTWLVSLTSLVLTLIGSNAIAKAEAAGQAAVDASPSPGAAPGKFEEF